MTKPSKWTLAGTVILVCAWLYKEDAASGLNLWQENGAAKRYLRENGLPTDREHVQLYRAYINPMTKPSKDWSSNNEAHDDCLRGVRSISVFLQPLFPWPMLEEEFAALEQKAKGYGIELALLTNRDELLQALSSGDIVIFSGHANYGRGMMLELHNGTMIPIAGANPLVPVDSITEGDVVMETFDNEMARILTGPVEGIDLAIGCRMFIHLGCRTEIYYGAALSKQAPDTVFVLTNYTWGPHLRMVDAVELLLDAISEGASLDHVLSGWERLFQDVILPGRIIEKNTHKIPGPYSDKIFVRRGVCR